MKIKIDENLSASHRRILEAAGHDVADVHDEGLAGAKDDDLWAHVCAEDRLLATLDVDLPTSDVSHPGTTLASSWYAPRTRAFRSSRPS